MAVENIKERPIFLCQETCSFSKHGRGKNKDEQVRDIADYGQDQERNLCSRTIRCHGEVPLLATM
jgi:hypothetical protein